MITVREYQKIFPADVPNFDALAKFSEAGDFLSVGWNYVQAKNYVGVIRLPDGFQIEILPKLDAPEDKLRDLVRQMLHKVNDFAGKKFRKASLDTARLNLYEIFIRTYLEMILEIVKRGLKSAYVVREENLNVFKGKLLVKPNVRENFAHREKFFVAFDEYNLDRPEHRLIKATLAKLLRTTNDPKNFRLTTRLLADFDSVEQSTNFAADFSAVSIDRLNRAYAVVMAWTKIFLRGKSFTAFAGQSEAQALLFPMEKLFEAYVAAHVKKIFSDRFTVRTQVRENFLFDAPKSFALKPDILLEGDETIIMDTKWKLAVTEADMYQMFAYAKRYAATKIFLLCPPDVDRNFYRADDGFNVTIYPVDLFNIANCLEKIFRV